MRGLTWDERGLTLIELMIVVGIISVIAVISMLIVYQDVSQKARLAADMGTAASLRSAVAIYYSKHDGNFPPSRTTVNFLVSPRPTFQCPGQSYTYDPTNGMVLLTIIAAPSC